MLEHAAVSMSIVLVAALLLLGSPSSSRIPSLWPPVVQAVAANISGGGAGGRGDRIKRFWKGAHQQAQAQQRLDDDDEEEEQQQGRRRKAKKEMKKRGPSWLASLFQRKVQRNIGEQQSQSTRSVVEADDEQQDQPRLLAATEVSRGGQSEAKSDANVAVGTDDFSSDTYDSNEDDGEISSGSDSNSSEDEEEEESTFPQQLVEKFNLEKFNFKSLKQKRRRFLDHIALISSSFLIKETPASLDVDGEEDDEDLTTEAHITHHHHKDDDITPQTDLSLPGRHFHIVTTAALPWMTGTAVNPLLRAAYLHRRTQQINTSYNLQPSPQHQSYVTLVIPWLELEEDQMELYGKQVFATPQEQEAYIRNWLEKEAGMPDAADPKSGLKLLFYPARYHSGLRSIFAMGDICQLIAEDASSGNSVMDVCVLEEPEHCNWYRAPGDGWTKKFHYVVGIVHTNYKEYASAHYTGLWTAPAIALLSSAMVKAYCHQVIKLSDVLQTFAPEKEATSNVHGVRSDFLNVGLARAKDLQQNRIQNTNNNDDNNAAEGDESETKASAYFIGKLLWAKGLDLMLELQDYYKQCTGNYFPIDIYGSGPEQKAIRRAYWGRKHVSKPGHHSGATATTASGSHVTADSEVNDTSNGHGHKHHHHRRKPRKYTVNTKIFTSKEAFKEHLRKIKESLPTTADHWRNFKESITSAELPTTFHEWRRQPIPATFPGRVDHASLGKHATQYKIFVNPSVSEVLCTTTAEALAMGKFAIIPVHPSNAFFLKFPNCLAYRNKVEFAANLRWALTHEPEPLTPELAHEFTWEAATDRFIQASAVTWKQAREREALGLSKRDERIAWFLNELGKGQKGDILRMVLGAGPASGQVKYVTEQQGKLEEDDDDEEEGNEGDEDEEDEGLTVKFHQSSFVQALRATLSSGLPSTIARNSREEV